MKAGGWVEDQEFDSNSSSDDGTIPADSKMKEWEAPWNPAVESVGMIGSCDPQKMAEQMKDAGFINITVKEYKMPLGPWPKDMRLRESGQYNLVGISEGLTGLSIHVFTQILGWSVEKTEILLAGQGRVEKTNCTQLFSDMGCLWTETSYKEIGWMKGKLPIISY